MIAALLTLWDLAILLVYAGSAAIGIGYSAANLRSTQRALRGLRELRRNGSAQVAAAGFRKLHVALLTAQGLQALLVMTAVLAGDGGPPSPAGVVTSAILVCMNLLLSYVSVAATTGRRRVLALVAKETRPEWDGQDRRQP